MIKAPRTIEDLFMFYVIWGAIIALCVIADQVTKYLVVNNIELDVGTVPVIDGILEFIYVQNTGAAFGSMQNSSGRIIFMTLSTVAIVGILIFMFWKKPSSKLFCASLALIAGGGIGNMIDRIFLKYVVDFINFIAFPKIWHFPFNIADSCVVVGSFLLILWLIIDTVREFRREKQKKLEAAIETSSDEAACGSSDDLDFDNADGEIAEDGDKVDTDEICDGSRGSTDGEDE